MIAATLPGGGGDHAGAGVVVRRPGGESKVRARSSTRPTAPIAFISDSGADPRRARHRFTTDTRRLAQPEDDVHDDDRDRTRHRVGADALSAGTPLPVTCPGGLIVHADGTVAGCTNDDDQDGCRGRELRHEGDPIVCWKWWEEGCNVCGLHP